MKLRNILWATALTVSVMACGDDDPITPSQDPTPDPTPVDTTDVDPDPDPTDTDTTTADFARGADISWCTQMEDEGHKFYTWNNREPMECTAAMQDLGMNAIRLRVWVTPTDKYCGKEDVLEKALRASKLGMDVMIDFHYSDTWADPDKQTIPTAWADHDYSQLLTDVRDHTTEVLQLLKDNGVTVRWVQIGNETNNGMLYPIGQADKHATQYRGLFGAGSDAARSVFPDVKVIAHLSNGYDQSLYKWNLDLLDDSKYDIIGMSLYPSEGVGSFFYTATNNARTTMSTQDDVINYTFKNMDYVYNRYRKPCMLVEVGLQVYYETASTLYMKEIMQQAREIGICQGVFYWEPESYNGWQNYDKGAYLSNGRPTQILDAFEK